MSDPREHTDRISAQESDHESHAAHERVPAPDPSAAPTGQWSRRRFGKTALGVTPIVATLYGRPLWAASNCTLSGWMSGNASIQRESETSCGGRTPEYWSRVQNPEWVAIKDQTLNSAFPTLNTTYTVNNDPATLQQALEDIPFDQGGPDVRELLRLGAAALLNLYWGDYSLSIASGGLTQEQALADMVATAARDEDFETAAGDMISPRQVREFLRNTMYTASWGD